MFDIEKSVRKRRSVRTYDKRKVDLCKREKIMEYAEGLQNPLGPKVTFRLLDKASDPKGDKLGTYGIIKGAELYVGAKIKREEYAPEALGYDFEQLVLYLTDMGLGTCWLGGTFNKGAFAEAMDVQDDEIFTIVSPIGYTADKMSLVEVMMRRGSGGDKRLPWEELFYDGDFGKSIAAGEADAVSEAKDVIGEYADVLEMVRLAPSAVNRQPWRIVAERGDAEGIKAFYFYQSGIKADDSESVQMHRIDMGIAICHFHLAALEKGLKGKFERVEPADVDAPENTAYIVTWRCE
ncbi:MAG: nitroreductase family protein [Firmicutes bacterium]|nr:nitroreductase family protein [Bacillota bacterium]